MNMYFELTVVDFSRMLRNLQAILNKASAFADAKKIDGKVLLNSRLAPDMLPLSAQIQIATDSAKGITARLTGQEPPSFADTETTMDEIKARVQKTIDFMATLKPAQFEGCEKRTISIAFRPGHSLPAPEFLHRMSIPNFYFHMTTSYSILRHNGVELGKFDYLGQIEFQKTTEVKN